MGSSPYLDVEGAVVGIFLFFFLDVCMFPFTRLPSPPPVRLKNGTSLQLCAPQQPSFCNSSSAASRGAAAGRLVHVQRSPLRACEVNLVGI